jgi:hypothetical protein
MRYNIELILHCMNYLYKILYCIYYLLPNIDRLTVRVRQSDLFNCVGGVPNNFTRDRFH